MLWLKMCHTGACTMRWDVRVLRLWECQWVEQHIGVCMGQWEVHDLITSIVLTAANQSRMVCSYVWHLWMLFQWQRRLMKWAMHLW